ncbi:MAG TPA: hypothetical protein VK622_01945 [Puia sp.]|nr:hypothetical protein [Puia sp.]
MRIHRIIIALSFSLITGRSLAQNGESETGKYHKFTVYAGAGPSYFINNLVILKDDVSNFKYAVSARLMWEPQHSFVALGFETGYFRLYSVKSRSPQPKADITNSSVPLMFVVSMKFSKKCYANWGMGQSITFNKVSNTDSSYNYNANTWSFSDFTATFGYRFVQKPTISYAAELKGYYSSSYQNATIALLFIVGFRL